MKILNGYAGIGGNRKFWGDEDEIIAIEYDEKIAAIYQDLWPNDQVIVTDAHQYLLDHYHEFDFIWMSPPCPTHSQVNSFLHAQGVVRYPDMKLWQEIIFLHTWAKCKWVVENVKPYYGDFARIGTPQVRGRHWFWANFHIPYGLKSQGVGKKSENRRGSVKIGRFGKVKNSNHTRGDNKENLDALGFDIDGYSGIDKLQALRNCVTPEIGLAIFQAAKGIYEANQRTAGTLF